MIVAEALNSSMNNEEIQAAIVLSLACYSAGDASGLQEWYEPLLQAGTLSGIAIVYNSNLYRISGRDYSDLVNLPPTAVLYRGEWVGAKNPMDDCRFIIDEKESIPRVFPYSIQAKNTGIFN